MAKRVATRRTIALVAVLAVAAAACQSTAQPAAPATASATPTASAAAPATGSTATGPAATAAPADMIRIPLSGSAPDAIQLDGDRAWVLAGEGGTLMEVDLVEGVELRAIEVGFGATHLVRVAEDTLAVGRFDDSTSGAYLLIVDTADGGLRGIDTGPLGGLAAAPGGQLWALEKDGGLLKVDVDRGGVVGETGVEIGQNVHTEVQWGLGSAWAGSDGTPTYRVDARDLEPEATIEVPTGLPFLFRTERLWGAGPTALWSVDGTTNELETVIPLENVAEILGMDVDGDDAWLAVRRPGQVGRVLRLDLASGDVVEEHDVSLPAAVRIGPDRAWVASYLDDQLLGFPR